MIYQSCNTLFTITILKCNKFRITSSEISACSNNCHKSIESYQCNELQRVAKDIAALIKMNCFNQANANANANAFWKFLKVRTLILMLFVKISNASANANAFWKKFQVGCFLEKLHAPKGQKNS